MKTKLKRKRGQILAAQYGYLWPIDRHDSGFCLVVNPVSRAYVWADNRETLYDIADAFGDTDGMGNSIC